MNPLFNAFNQNPIQNNSPQQQGGPLSMIQTVGQFLSMRNMNAETIVRNLISSGRMSQEQFNQLAQNANQILGRRQ